ncbi:MAG: hypothetical protein N4A65_00905 [Cohaesibacter sp.]|jgi:hypothetical protein|nr:hypothetical protein [Cohaesibacter sp.]
MMGIEQVEMVKFLGVFLAVVGVAIQFWDWWEIGKDEDRIFNIEDYMEEMDKIDASWKEMDAPPKGTMVTEDGLDIGETIRIVREAGEEARIKNQELLQSVKRAKQEVRRKHRPFLFLSWVLIVLGTVLAAI